jgi:chromosome segregation ATPase
MEKLLSAVDRLRGERDELRRQLEFLQVESKFTIEALQSKEAALRKVDAAAEDPRVFQLQAEVQELLERLARTSSSSRVNLPSPAVDPSRLGLIASASLVMVEHLQTQVDHDVALKEKAGVEISHLRSQLQDSVVSHDESVLDMQHHLHDTRQQRDDLLLKVEHLQSQIAANARIREQFRELQSSLEGTAGRLSDTTKALEDAESERNSLKVELVNLHKDMALAKEELKQAEQRYSDLQNQQLSSMSSSQVNRKLKEQIEELEGRVARRTEQIGIHQHDIRRLETNLKLQEDRISEMTSELEVAMSEKESMVEDCADAREARDRALKKAEDLEDAVATLETQTQALEEQRQLEVATLVEVWSSTLAQSRSSMTRLRAVAHQMDAAEVDMTRQLKLVSAEHNHAAALLNQQASELELVQEAAITHREEARGAVVALAVTQTASAEIRRGISHDRNQIYALLLATRNELHDRLKEIDSLHDQIRRMRSRDDADSIEQQSAHLAEVAKLQQANTDHDELRTELEGQVTQSQKELRLAFEQQDQLDADMIAIKAQMARLQSDHAEELESLRGKLQQVAVDLQEAREAHAVAEKACSELSATNAELENRLDNISQRQDTENELIAELQSREAVHTKQMLDMQDRLDNAMEELQQMTSEKAELEILLHQTKTELSQAKDAMEGRVSELLEERDALQERLVSVESHQAKEIAQEQRRLRDLEVESDSLRAQLDKATADQRRMRTTFEMELRESVEHLEESRAQLDDVKAQLSALEAEFDGMEGRLETALEEKDVLEAKNTNLESEIQRAFSIHRYIESQLKDRSAASVLCFFFLPLTLLVFSANESAAVKTELERMEEKYMRSERDGKAAEIQLSFQTTQHNQAVATLKREIQLLQAASRPDERIQELEEKIGYMDELMRSKTLEIEENDDRFIE